jgi:hypothetical protein
MERVCCVEKKILNKKKNRRQRESVGEKRARKGVAAASQPAPALAGRDCRWESLRASIWTHLVLLEVLVAKTHAHLLSM